MAPGGEFRAAHRASFNVQGCRVILGDRPIGITLQRALSSLGFFQKLRLIFHVISTNFSDITYVSLMNMSFAHLCQILAQKMWKGRQAMTIWPCIKDRYWQKGIASAHTYEQSDACQITMQ